VRSASSSANELSWVWSGEGKCCRGGAGRPSPIGRQIRAPYANPRFTKSNPFPAVAMLIDADAVTGEVDVASMV
jgi:hypothetical protein